MSADKVECPDCGSSRLQPSKFRLRDFGPLLKMRRAVRCQKCGFRGYLPLYTVWQMQSKQKANLVSHVVRKN